MPVSHLRPTKSEFGRWQVVGTSYPLNVKALAVTLICSGGRQWLSRLPCVCWSGRCQSSRLRLHRPGTDFQTHSLRRPRSPTSLLFWRHNRLTFKFIPRHRAFSHLMMQREEPARPGEWQRCWTPLSTQCCGDEAWVICWTPASSPSSRLLTTGEVSPKGCQCWVSSLGRLTLKTYK